MSKIGATVAALLALAGGSAALAAPSVGKTTVLGPFVGVQAKLHPDNVSPNPIRFYGTDLGFSYQYKGQLQFLFGDTMATEQGEPIEASTGRLHEDSFGSVDLAAAGDPSKFAPGNVPLIRLGQNPGSSEMAAIDPGHAMEGFKTPVGGFSNGLQEFGLFFTYKPRGCTSDEQCPDGLQCDTGLGYIGQPPSADEGHTFGCVDGSLPQCVADTLTDAQGQAVPDSGLCVDRGSTYYADTPIGRVGALGVRLLVGTRDPDVPKRYTTDHIWLTSRFMNPSVRTVRHFDPAHPDASDFRPATAPAPTARVFVWGRPGFDGVNATGRTLGQYFAWADLPAGPGYDWKLHYFTGLDEQGRPRFSDEETEAAALDLDSTRDGVQPAEALDIVNQVSIAWVEPLRKWIMFYGGGMSTLPIAPALTLCGVLQVFTGPECTQVKVGDGGFYMRSADAPWGPWTPPQEVIAGGDPAVPGSGQYGAGGMLRHPDCTESNCAPHTVARDVNPGEYGFFYSANIIEQWTRPAGNGVDLIWNASTWDPYRVILLRTHIDP